MELWEQYYHEQVSLRNRFEAGSISDVWKQLETTGKQIKEKNSIIGDMKDSLNDLRRGLNTVSEENSTLRELRDVYELIISAQKERYIQTLKTINDLALQCSQYRAKRSSIQSKSDLLSAPFEMSARWTHNECRLSHLDIDDGPIHPGYLRNQSEYVVENDTTLSIVDPPENSTKWETIRTSSLNTNKDIFTPDNKSNINPNRRIFTSSRLLKPESNIIVNKKYGESSKITDSSSSKRSHNNDLANIIKRSHVPEQYTNKIENHQSESRFSNSQHCNHNSTNQYFNKKVDNNCSRILNSEPKSKKVRYNTEKRKSIDSKTSAVLISSQVDSPRTDISIEYSRNPSVWSADDNSDISINTFIRKESSYESYPTNKDQLHNFKNENKKHYSFISKNSNIENQSMTSLENVIQSSSESLKSPQNIYNDKNFNDRVYQKNSDDNIDSYVSLRDQLLSNNEVSYNITDRYICNLKKITSILVPSGTFLRMISGACSSMTGTRDFHLCYDMNSVYLGTSGATTFLPVNTYSGIIMNVQPLYLRNLAAVWTRDEKDELHLTDIRTRTTLQIPIPESSYPTTCFTVKDLMTDLFLFQALTNQCRVFSVSENRVIATLKKATVISAVWVNSSTVVVADTNGTISLWNMKETEHKEIFSIPNTNTVIHRNWVNTLSLVEDDKVLISSISWVGLINFNGEIQWSRKIDIIPEDQPTLLENLNDKSGIKRQTHSVKVKTDKKQNIITELAKSVNIIFAERPSFYHFIKATLGHIPESRKKYQLALSFPYSSKQWHLAHCLIRTTAVILDDLVFITNTGNKQILSYELLTGNIVDCPSFPLDSLEPDSQMEGKKRKQNNILSTSTPIVAISGFQTLLILLLNGSLIEYSRNFVKT